MEKAKYVAIIAESPKITRLTTMAATAPVLIWLPPLTGDVVALFGPVEEEFDGREGLEELWDIVAVAEEYGVGIWDAEDGITIEI